MGKKEDIISSIYRKALDSGIEILEINDKATDVNKLQLDVVLADERERNQLISLLEEMFSSNNFNVLDSDYIDVIKIDIMIDNITESEDTKAISLDEDKVIKVSGPKDNIREYESGAIEVDQIWTFNCLSQKEAEKVQIRGTFEIGIIQQFDWTRLVGYFLSDPEFAGNEIFAPDGCSGRWVIKGITPFGSERFFIINDLNGDVIVHVSSSSKDGLYELGDWLLEKFEKSILIKYERKFKFKDGSTGTFGIDATGEPYESWSGAGWLKSWGIK